MSVTSSCPTFSSVYFSFFFSPPNILWEIPLLSGKEPVDSMDNLLIKHSEIDLNVKMRGHHDSSRMLSCLQVWECVTTCVKM